MCIRDRRRVHGGVPQTKIEGGFPCQCHAVTTFSDQPTIILERQKPNLSIVCIDNIHHPSDKSEKIRASSCKNLMESGASNQDQRGKHQAIQGEERGSPKVLSNELLDLNKKTYEASDKQDHPQSCECLTARSRKDILHSA
eukprot:TRINITY_DN3994_c0_g1_i10.p1 TRINITY_DN3994_c0_g1~~TRINITY_DN3994_c0_g1_i10.p1  ORF type:complete len:141 (-),score=16.84 TRINITY_DN3994_c0_g1_i10:337-759(-)